MGKTVLIFGTFDGIHEGHRALFAEAKTYGDRLLVVVARDITVETLKRHRPKYTEEERQAALRQEPLVDAVHIGDDVLGDYEVLKRFRPDVVGIGYDQEELFIDLERWKTANRPDLVLVRLHPFEPASYKSSLL